MTVTEESGGRLNAFAKEPQIEVINPKTSYNNRFQPLILVGSILLIGIIGFYLIIK
ncbi:MULTISPECIES: hypothetical protein [Prochlorococcus]|uniref:hypothetical protein n=1 Tax=Prochlorococcus TaxID=1218 RepID=UPI00053386EC|nr:MULTISPECIES: hypothetical protein [Prochlorococcus]KGG13694.1 HLIP family protein [Prochlorococcus sp. MIT 0601]